MNRAQTGILGEKIARNYITKKGYQILETNYRCREGEIDIISKKKDCLVFIEVRTKSSKDFGTPEESLNASKKKKLIKSVFTWLTSHKNVPDLWRIDFIAVELDSLGQLTRISIIEDAMS